MIDWNKPIEAVHEDGRVVSVTLMRHGQGPWYDVTPSLGAHWSFQPEGHHSDPLCKWRIRNVASTTPERDPALWDRMEALVREMASQRGPEPRFIERARAIVAALPKPVDPDLIEARSIVANAKPHVAEYSGQDILAGLEDDCFAMLVALAGIRRGRALQRGEA